MGVDPDRVELLGGGGSEEGEVELNSCSIMNGPDRVELLGPGGGEV